MTVPLRNEQRVLNLYGPRELRLELQPVPQPGFGELVVAIEAATTCGTDLKVYRRGGHPTMLQTPCPFGHEFSGRVAACGSGVKPWREGDAVVVANSVSCGECSWCREGQSNLCPHLVYLNGAYGEYVRIPEAFARRSIYRRPPGLAAELASMSEPLACVLHGIRACDELADRQVLLLGGGPIGQMFVIELVRRGAKVVLADLNFERLAVGRRLGAQATVALEVGEDHRALLEGVAEREGFSLVIEATGSPTAWVNAIASLRPGGTVVLFGGCAPGQTVPLDTHRLHYSELTVRGVYHHRPETFVEALTTIEADPDAFSQLIDVRVGLSGVEAALQRMEAGEILKAAVDPHLDSIAP